MLCVREAVAGLLLRAACGDSESDTPFVEALTHGPTGGTVLGPVESTVRVLEPLTAQAALATLEAQEGVVRDPPGAREGIDTTHAPD